MSTINRRDWLRTSALGAGGAALAQFARTGVWAQSSGEGIPLVHITDLYHPPQDPDDHIDLATVAALPELDLKAVILDNTRRFMVPAPEGFDIRRDPGYVPVAQMSHLLGRAIPVGMGPLEMLATADDDASDRPLREQSGIRLLLEVLDRSPVPVYISAVGSARVVAAAFNLEPDLLLEKTAAVLLNAGSTGGPKREWNVGLDPLAYIRLWQSGLPVHWYPCSTETGAFNPDHERGTYWKAKHADLFDGLPSPWKAWLAYALGGNGRGDVIGLLSENVGGAVWEQMMAGERNMWVTASLAQLAGRRLCRTPEGWRFRPASEAEGEPWPMRLDPIEASVDTYANVTWNLSAGGKHRLFGRQKGADYGMAMAEALNALLRGLPG